jgi:hypothetical protein
MGDPPGGSPMKTGFSFDETMSGTMTRLSDGATVPFSFTVRVHQRSLRNQLRDGKAEMRGTIEAPGIAAAAECEGTMTLRPVRERIIRYELDFRGDDGRRYRFEGQKDIRWLDALRTWTTLPGEITDEAGKVVARCDTRFDYKSDWMQFVTSWKPA